MTDTPGRVEHGDVNGEIVIDELEDPLEPSPPSTEDDVYDPLVERTVEVCFLPSIGTLNVHVALCI